MHRQIWFQLFYKHHGLHVCGQRYAVPVLFFDGSLPIVMCCCVFSIYCKIQYSCGRSMSDENLYICRYVMPLFPQFSLCIDGECPSITELRLPWCTIE